MQAFAPIPQPLSEPHCLIWYPGDSCDQLLQQYRQALESRQRQEWQSSAIAPFEKQIADQQKQIADQKAQIATLQSRIDSQTMEALRSEAHNQAVMDSLGVIIGIGIAFVMVLAFFRKLTRPSPNATPERSRAASA
jgi:PIN domain nuclease of toxin-antitoxin system